MVFSPRARRGSMWFSWPSVAHRLHGPPLKFMKSSSSLPPLRRVILHVRDFYYWNDTFMTARPRHTRAASWIISAKGGRNEIWQIIGGTPPAQRRSSQYANFHEWKNNLTCIKLKFTKNHDLGGGYERRLSGGLLRGRWGRRWIGGGVSLLRCLLFRGPLWTYSVRDSGIQSNIMQTSALWSCF